MSNRTREIFDFAQLEPEAVDELESMVQICSEDDIDHIETVAESVLEAIARLETPHGILDLKGT